MKIATPADVPELFVVDASIAVKWLVTESDSHLALHFATSHDLLAPASMRFGVANILWKYVRRSVLRDAWALTMPEDLDFWLQSRTPDLNLATAARQLACAYSLPLFDCIYLALANVTGASLITTDKKLASVAQNPNYSGCKLHLLSEYFTPAI